MNGIFLCIFSYVASIGIPKESENCSLRWWLLSYWYVLFCVCDSVGRLDDEERHFIRLKGLLINDTRRKRIKNLPSQGCVQTAEMKTNVPVREI